VASKTGNEEEEKHCEGASGSHDNLVLASANSSWRAIPQIRSEFRAPHRNEISI
jgi:hypothetical protein